MVKHPLTSRNDLGFYRMSLRRWRIDDAEIGSWKAADGWLIRTGLWHASAPRGTIFFLNGRGDFLEKYAEACRQWQGGGYTVFSWDWRGQGLSGRLFGDRTHAQLESFNPMLSDALGILHDPSVQKMPRPWIIVGHSMGGHLALRMLHDEPSIFEKAILLAPMLGINSGPLPGRMISRFVRLMKATGQGKRFALGQSPYGALTRSKFRQQRLTSDVTRFKEEGEAIDATPELAPGGVTFGWVDAAFRSLEIISVPGYMESIQTPTLVLLAGREQVVDSHAGEALSKRLPAGQTCWIEGGSHELLRERDDIRDAVMSRIMTFIDTGHS